MGERQARLSLCLDESVMLHVFKVFYERDKECQVHCLYSDASLYVHNEETGEIITVILLDRGGLEEYLEHAGESIHDNLPTHKCAKLHELVKMNENDSSIKKRALESKREVDGTYEYVKKKKLRIINK